MKRPQLVVSLAVATALALGGLGIALAYEYARPAAAIPDEPIYYVVTRQKRMALTFDISWGDKTVAQVLPVLRQYHQKATFFLSGPWAENHPQAVKEIVADGHEIASHGEAHVNLSGVSDAGIAANLRAADGVLKRLSGQIPRFFRPPNGDYDARVVRVARESGYETVIWSIVAGAANGTTANT